MSEIIPLILAPSNLFLPSSLLQQSDEVSCSPESSFITAAHSTVLSAAQPVSSGGVVGSSSRNTANQNHLNNSSKKNNNSHSPAKRSLGAIAAKTVSSTNLLTSTDSVSINSEQDEGRGTPNGTSERNESRAELRDNVGGEEETELSDVDQQPSANDLADDDEEVEPEVTSTPTSTKVPRKCVYKAAEYVVAVHRQLSRQDTYFLQYHKMKPNLFGLPLLVPWYEGCTNKDLYCAVWIQVARFLSPLPPTPPDQANHATDW